MKISVWLILLTLVSCFEQKKSSVDFSEFDYKVTSEWIYADVVSGIKSNGEVISRPPRTEQLVMELKIQNQGGVQFKKHCVYYLIPYKNHQGILRVEEIKDLGSCPEESTGQSLFTSLVDVNHLKISWEKFKIIFSFDHKKMSKVIEVPTPNVEVGLIHEKYKSLQEKRLLSGLRFLRFTEESMDTSLGHYLGKLSDRFSQGNAIRCHQVNKDCVTIGENRCEDCRYGWYEAVDFECPQGGSKFCGQNHCGEKNEPACPRGIKVTEETERGICQNDLEPMPNPEKILVCQ